MSFVVGVVGLGVILGIRAASSTPVQDLSFQMPPSELASEIMADGVITEDEYATAMRATVECARGEGILMTTPRFDGRQYVYVVLADDEEIAAFDACYGQYLSRVERAWVSQIDAKIDQSQIYPNWVECMRRKGHEISNDAEPKDLLSQLPVEAAKDSDTCIAEADPRIKPPTDPDWDRVYLRYQACMAEAGHKVPDAKGLTDIGATVRSMEVEFGSVSSLCFAQAEVDERLGFGKP
ncbi:MAG: hypothetical protein ACE5F5_05215 [Acidimicrobiia bacterium]